MKAIFIRTLIPISLILTYAILWLGGQKLHMLFGPGEEPPPTCLTLASDKPAYYRLEMDDLKNSPCPNGVAGVDRSDVFTKYLTRATKKDRILHAKYDVSDTPEIRPEPGFNYLTVTVTDAVLAASAHIGDRLHGCVQALKQDQQSVSIRSQCTSEPLEIIAVVRGSTGDTLFALRFPSEMAVEHAEIIASPLRVWQLTAKTQ